MIGCAHGAAEGSLRESFHSQSNDGRGELIRPAALSAMPVVKEVRTIVAAIERALKAPIALATYVILTDHASTHGTRTLLHDMPAGEFR
jgi:hypothetical protein